MNTVGSSASGVRSTSRMARRLERPGTAVTPDLLHLAGDALAGAPGGVEEDLVEGRVVVERLPLPQLGLQLLRASPPAR